MNDLTLTTAAAGLASSIVTELLKLIPFLRSSSITIAITAIVVTSIVSFIANGLTFSLENVISTLVFSLVSYRLVVQPIATDTDMKSQG